jgi:hypothetical protein
MIPIGGHRSLTIQARLNPSSSPCRSISVKIAPIDASVDRIPRASSAFAASRVWKPASRNSSATRHADQWLIFDHQYGRPRHWLHRSDLRHARKISGRAICSCRLQQRRAQPDVRGNRHCVIAGGKQFSFDCRRGAHRVVTLTSSKAEPGVIAEGFASICPIYQMRESRLGCDSVSIPSVTTQMSALLRAHKPSTMRTAPSERQTQAGLQDDAGDGESMARVADRVTAD